MNREIKFRGFWKDIEEKLHYKIGNLNIVNNKEHVGYYISNDYGSPFAYKVIPETIGQYTGLKDKNGKEIYEGDIVMYDNEWTKPNETGVITWNKNNSSFQIKGHIPSSSMKHLNRMKVIGNIYESEVTNGK